MATIKRDGFDFYGSVADIGANYWDLVNSIGGNEVTLTTAANTRFGVGQAIEESGANNNTVLQQNIGSNEATIFCALAMFNPLAFNGQTTSGAQLRFVDSATLQCTVLWALDGAIRFYRGDTLTGTLLATFSGAYSALTWAGWNVKVIIDGTNGEIHIRKNGATSDTFVATGLNTKSSANAFATQVQVFSRFANVRFDDVWFYSGSGAVPNDFIGDVRAVQIMPSADNAVTFSPPSATIECGSTTTSSTAGSNANQQGTLGTFVARDGTLASVNLFFNAGVTGNVKVAVYDSDGASGAPKTLMATSNQVTNPGAGQNTFTFGSPPALTGNHTYWLAWLSDVSATLVTATTPNPSFYFQNQTYATGFFSPWTGFTISGTKQVKMNIPVTAAGNFAYEEELAEDGNLSYVQNATVGQVDLYANAGLPITPNSILGVTVRSFQSKSDAGSRGGAVRLKSGATIVDGPTVNLSNSYQNVYLIQDVDPNTSAAWTLTGILNALFGPKVAT